MKKIITLITFVFISEIAFSQVKMQKNIDFHVIKSPIHAKATAETKAVVGSLHYDGENIHSTGTAQNTSTLGAYVFFPEFYTAGHHNLGNTITSVQIFINGHTTVSSATIKIFSDRGNTLLYSTSFTPVEGWNEVLLTSPFPIPDSDMYIGYELVAYGYPMGLDSSTTVNPNGNWIVNDANWSHLYDTYSQTGNWNIRAMVSGTSLSVPIASVNKTTWDAGSVSIGQTGTSQTIELHNAGGDTLTISSIIGLSEPYATSLIPSTVHLAIDAGQSTLFTFSYTPTSSDVSNQTLTLITNGGNITFNLTGKGVQCPVIINTFPWTESFEGASFPPACWTKETRDGGVGWTSINSGTTPLPGYGGGTLSTPTYGGNNAAFVTWYQCAYTPKDEWLITPQVEVPAGKSLSFFVYRYGDNQDFLTIKSSSTDNQLDSFTDTLIALDSNSMPFDQWTFKQLDLSALSGQTVYFAFNETVSENHFSGAFIALDLVSIDNSASINKNEATKEWVNIYPNPANNLLYIAANQITVVDIFNLAGEKVASYKGVNVVDVANLAEGTYLVKVITKTNISTKKINIIR